MAIVMVAVMAAAVMMMMMMALTGYPLPERASA